MGELRLYLCNEALSKKNFPTVYHLVGFVLCILSLSAPSRGDKRVVCWYESFDPFHQSNELEDFPVHLCTDILFSGASINQDDWEVTEFDFIGRYHIGTRFRAKASNLSSPPKLFLTVGKDFLWPDRIERFEPENKWPEMAADASKRTTFVTSVLQLVRDQGYDGLNIQWEDPGLNDRENYVTLVEEFVKKKPRHLLLTSTVTLDDIPYYTPSNLSGINFEVLSKLLDWINVLPEINKRYEHVDVFSPLYRRYFDYETGKVLHNMHDCLEILVQQGAPRHKLMLGISFQGKTFTLKKKNGAVKFDPANKEPKLEYENDLNALPDASYPYGKHDDSLRQKGTLYYHEICVLLDSGKWERRFDHEGKTPFAYFNDQWVGYDDEESIRIKMQYVKDRGYAGVNLRFTNKDVFRNNCGSIRFPLLHAAHLHSKENRQQVATSVNEILCKRLKAMGMSFTDAKCP